MSIQRAALLKYSLLAFPLAFAGLPIYVHSPDFYATQFGQSLTLIGLILLCLRVIDAVQDPFIGMISDRYHLHRRKIISVGMVMLALGFYMTFHPPETYILLWFALSILICTTGYSVVTINLQTAGGLWSVDTQQRSRVSSWREAFGVCGLLIASITPPLLMNIYDAEFAFHVVTIAYIPIILICGFVFLRWYQKTDFDSPLAQQPQSIIVLFNDKWFKNFALIFSLSSLASAIPGVLVLFFIRDYLGLESQTGPFLLCYFLAGIIAMPLWIKTAQKYGKVNAWLLGMVLSVLTFIWAFGLDAGEDTAFFIICMLSGAALGADLALPPAIMADYIATNQSQHLASRYYSIMAFLSKAALALATGLTLPLLGMMGYQPGNTFGAENLPIAYALTPCLIKLAAAFILYRNRL